MLDIDTLKMPSSVLKAYLVEKLRDAIITRKFEPGERLNETNLASRYNVSRVAVREALMQLQLQGLVMNHPRRGMFVNSLSEVDSQKINSLRIPLEAEALRLCKTSANKQMVKHLASLVVQMEKWDSGSQFESAELDLQFHRAVWVYSGNTYLAKSLNSFAPILFAHRALDGMTDERRRWNLRDHRSLLDVIEGKSDRTPEEAILAHLKIGYDEPGKFSSFAGELTTKDAAKA
ncbi:MAG TPA: GntR family transcriptional regulator [Granulicella sp.]